MKEKLKEIEEKLDSLIAKIDGIDDWINDLDEDFLGDFTEFNQSHMFSWFHLADSVQRMETILLALNQKYNINSDGIDIDLNRKVIDLERALAKEKSKSEKYSKKSNIALLGKESKTWEDVLYKLAHSINNDLHSAGHILSEKKNDPEIIQASYHIKRIDDLIKLNLWLLKRNELHEQWSQMNIGEEVVSLISSTKRGSSTLRVSATHEQKLVSKIIDPVISGNVNIQIGNEKLDVIISLILQDLIRNTLKYSDENDPEVAISVDGNNENYITITFTNNKIMDDKFLRYINLGDAEPNISDSSKVGLRSIMEWVKFLQFDITCWNSEVKAECNIKLSIPRSIVYETN